MHRIYIFTLLLFVSAIGFAQTNLEMNMIFGGNATDEAKDIKANPDQTSIFLGASTFSTDGDIPENAGGRDYWIMKMDLEGNSIWNSTFGGGSDDQLEALLPHPDGGTYAFGTTRSSQGIFGTLLGQTGAWIMRTSPGGSIVDGQIFGGTLGESGVDAYRHTDGDITLAISASSEVLFGEENNGILDVWIVHVNESLSNQWAFLAGGAGADVPNAITGDNNGNIYVAATSDSNLPGLPENVGGTDLWVMKINGEGVVEWQQTFGGSEDEVANDIIVHANGDVYVVVQSDSDDGDFPGNHGINDIWMLKLNSEDGTVTDMYQYGGGGNEFNAKLNFTNDGNIVVTATSTSSDVDLTGNKGFSDVWTFTTDLNGIILSQMNYGGSLNDQVGGIVSIDSVFHVFSSSISKDKNVPINTLSQLNTWYYTLNPYPDSCSTNFICLQDSTTTNHLYPPADNSLICVEGCTGGYGPGPLLNDDDCPDFIHATSYFYITTDTTADLLTLSVNSDEFNRPQLGLFRSVNCTTFQPVVCATGEFGSVVMNYIEVDPLTTYVIAISDMEGNVGKYELCATSIDVDFCNKSDRIFVTSTSMGSNFVGPYKPGEEVQICYELDDWDKLECNGFQGILPTFGPGWDESSFNSDGRPIQVDSMLMPATEGFWAWHGLGEVHYNTFNPVNGYEGGQGLPGGWYFTNTTDPPPADEPDQTTGDIDNCINNSDSWKVCFTLKVVEECDANLDCSITVKTFADGEIGVNTNLGCGYDQKEVFEASMVCCINPSVQPIQNLTICSGDTLTFVPETNLFPPVTYSWTADPDPFVMGAASGNNLPQFFQILENETAIPLVVRYSIMAETDNCETDFEDFDVTVNPQPISRLTLSGPNIICSGETVTLNFESTGSPPFVIGLYKDNEPFIDILSETTLISLEIDPVFSGVFRIGSVQDANCEGFGTGTVSVTVKPVASILIDTTICEGESLLVGDEEFTMPGSYTVIIEGGAENNCDSIINVTMGVVPPVTETIDEVICNGDTLFVLGNPYTETIDTVLEYLGPQNCPNYIILNLLVMDTFSMDIEQTICFGDTLDFGGMQVYEPGVYSSVEEVQPGCFEETVLTLSVLPEIFINDLSIMGDNGSGSGAILVEIKGGTPPLSYLWNTGHTTESLFGLDHGDYTLTVTDNLGCDQVFVFTVPMISSTGDPGALNSEIQIFPTILSLQDKLQVVNSGSTQFRLTGVEWMSMTGQPVSSALHMVLDAGGTIQLDVPDQLTSGTYFVRVIADRQAMAWTKVMIIQ